MSKVYFEGGTTIVYIECGHAESHGARGLVFCHAEAKVILNMNIYNLNGTEDHHLKDLTMCERCAAKTFEDYACRLGAKKHITVDIRPIDGPQPEEKPKRRRHT